MATSQSVIRTYLVMTGLYGLAASLIWGVNTLFLLNAGLSVLGVFIANAAFTAAMMVFEVPTGVVADLQGRRRSFLLSIATLLVGTLGYWANAHWGMGLWGFCAWSVVLGLGYTFYSGAMEAWLIDALAATGFDGSTDEVFARSSMVFGVSMLCGTVSGGLLGGVDLGLPYLVRSVLLVGVFAVAWTSMRDLGFSPVEAPLRELPQQIRRITMQSLEYGWGIPSVRLLILAGAVVAFSSAWGFHSWQPYFLELLDTDAIWVAGVIAAAASLSAMAGNSLVAWFSRYCGNRTTLLLWGYGAQAAAFIAVGMANNFWVACGFYLVAMAASGVVSPVQSAYLHSCIPSEQRATVLSFSSLVSSGTSVAGQTSLGYLAQRVGFAPGYAIGGVVNILALPLILGVRRRREPADRIVGSASTQGSCPSGLPESTAV